MITHVGGSGEPHAGRAAGPSWARLVGAAEALPGWVGEGLGTGGWGVVGRCQGEFADCAAILGTWEVGQSPANNIPLAILLWS